MNIRHALPAIPFLILAAAYAFQWVWQMGAGQPFHWPRVAAVALLLGHGASVAAAFPHHIAYANELLDAKGKYVLLYSENWNLGQDMKRLAARLHEVGATEVAFDPFIRAHLERVHGFPPIQPLDPNGPQPGWNAVSLTMLKLHAMGLRREHPDIKLWPDVIPPTERVGKGVLLYFVPAR